MCCRGVRACVEGYCTKMSKQDHFCASGAHCGGLCGLSASPGDGHDGARHRILPQGARRARRHRCWASENLYSTNTIACSLTTSLRTQALHTQTPLLQDGVSKQNLLGGNRLRRGLAQAVNLRVPRDVGHGRVLWRLAVDVGRTALFRAEGVVAARRLLLHVVGHCEKKRAGERKSASGDERKGRQKR